MTSIAVTASMCASASEAALLVASFMQFSPGLWARVIVARKGLMTRFYFYSEHPATSIRFD